MLVDFFYKEIVKYTCIYPSLVGHLKSAGGPRFGQHWCISFHLFDAHNNLPVFDVKCRIPTPQSLSLWFWTLWPPWHIRSSGHLRTTPLTRYIVREYKLVPCA